FQTQTPFLLAAAAVSRFQVSSYYCVQTEQLRKRERNMKRWILGAAVFIALAGMVLPNVAVTRAGRGQGAAPGQQPEAPASISLPAFLSGLSAPVGVYNAGDESN